MNQAGREIRSGNVQINARGIVSPATVDKVGAVSTSARFFAARRNELQLSTWIRACSFVHISTIHTRATNSRENERNNTTNENNETEGRRRIKKRKKEREREREK